MVVVLLMTARTLSMAILSLCLASAQKLLANCILFLIMLKPFLGGNHLNDWSVLVPLHCGPKIFIVGYQLYDMGVTAVVI